MDGMEKTGFWRAENAPLFAAIALYASCWFLPILDEHIGFDGAREAHTAFWKLLAGEYSVDSSVKIFEIIFISLGWLANEIFVLGVFVHRLKPALSVRCIAISLGVMVSWQIYFLEKFPLLIGYWFWVAAGLIMLYFSVKLLARETNGTVKAIIIEPVTLSLLLIPIINAVIGALVGMKL